MTIAALNFAGPEEPVSKLTFVLHQQLMDNIMNQHEKLPHEAVYTFQVATMAALIQTAALLCVMHFGVEQMEEIKPLAHNQLDQYLTWATEACLAQIREQSN